MATNSGVLNVVHNCFNILSLICIILVINLSYCVVTPFGIIERNANNTDLPHAVLNHLNEDSAFHKYMRPVRQLDEPITIKVGIALNQIIHLDEHSQVLQTNIWMRQYWQDPFLMWDPEDFNGTEYLHLPHKSIWRPDLALYNNADKEFHPTFENIIVTVNYTGDIIYLFPSIHRTSCRMDIRYFPFDQQECFIKYGSWGYDGTNLDVQLLEDNAADCTNFEYNSEWALVSFTAEREVTKYRCCPGMPYPSVIFHVKIRRRWTLHFFYLLMPNLLINITAITQFLLPCDSGEKVTLSITIYLSMVVYLLIMQEILPSSEDIPIIVKYIVTTMVLVAFSQTLNIFVLQLHHNGAHDNHRRLPLWTRRIFLHGIAKILCMHRYIVPDEVHETKLAGHISNLSIIPESNDEKHEDEESESEHELNCSSEQETSVIIPEIIPIAKSKPTLSHRVAPEVSKSGSASVSKIAASNVDKKEKTVDFMPHEYFERSHSKRRSSVNIIGDSQKSVTMIKRGDLKQNKELLLYKILKICEDNKERRCDNDAENEIVCEWQQLAMVIDRLMFCFYILATFTVWIVMFANIPQYDEDVIV